MRILRAPYQVFLLLLGTSTLFLFGCTRSTTPLLVNQTAPTLITLLPAGGYVNPTPTSVIATFSQVMSTISTSAFTIGGTCSTAPTVSSVAMSSGNTVATATLTGGSCTNGQSLGVTLDPTKVTNALGIAGTGSAVAKTFTVNTGGPSASLGLPSNTTLNSSGSSTIPVAFTASVSGGTTLTGTLTATGGGVSLTTVTGNPLCSTVAVSSLSTEGATITLSNCSGNGTLTVHVNAGTVQDSEGNPSTVSPESSIITVDNTGPTLVTLAPATGTVNPVPTTLVATFSKAVTTVSTSKFVLGGSCTTAPTVSSVAMSSSMVATAALSGGTCANGQHLTVTVNPASITDLVGNSGTGSSVTNTYSVDTSGPSANLANPSSTDINSAATSTIALTYVASVSGGTVLTGTLTAAGGGVTVTPVTGNPSCTVAVSSISTAGATITLSSCSGNGTLTVHVNAGTVHDSLGNPSTVSPESLVITVDNTPPTLSSSSTSNGSGVLAMPGSIALTFSEAVHVVASDFNVTASTCSTPPTVSSVTGSGTASITVSFSTAVCAAGQSMTLTIAMSSIEDLAGNQGSGSQTIAVTVAVTQQKKIFVTTSTTITSGNFGGISGADALCASDPNKPSGSATYKALLSDGSSRIACTTSNCSGGASENTGWVMSPYTVYTTPGGLEIGVTNAAGIFNFPLINPLIFNASNPNWVATGLQYDWTSSPTYNCAKWTSGATSNVWMTVGLSTYTDANVINSAAPGDQIPIGFIRCAGYTYSLYCVQQ